MTKPNDKANATNDKANGANDANDKGFKAFLQSVSKDGKVPSYIVPKDIASFLGMNDKRIRSILRDQGVYATVHKDGKREHRFSTDKANIDATKAMYEYIANKANGANDRKGNIAYNEVDWSNL